MKLKTKYLSWSIDFRWCFWTFEDLPLWFLTLIQFHWIFRCFLSALTVFLHFVNLNFPLALIVFYLLVSSDLLCLMIRTCRVFVRLNRVVQVLWSILQLSRKLVLCFELYLRLGILCIGHEFCWRNRWVRRSRVCFWLVWVRFIWLHQRWHFKVFGIWFRGRFWWRYCIKWWSRWWIWYCQTDEWRFWHGVVKWVVCFYDDDFRVVVVVIFLCRVIVWGCDSILLIVNCPFWESQVSREWRDISGVRWAFLGKE